MSAPVRAVVVGGGLAGITAALDLADAGAQVTVVERRTRLGGLTWSFDRKGLTFDNGQHVFLRCCTAYRGFLRRIGAADQVHLQDRLDVPVVAPGGRVAHISRSPLPLPSPLHLAASLLAYRHLPWRDRIGLAQAVRGLRGLELGHPDLDSETFGAWLVRHGQGPAAIERLWDLVSLPTVNVGCAEASLTLGAKVFRTGLLDGTHGADIGWSRVPLGELHGANGTRALGAAGVELLTSTSATAVTARAAGGPLAVAVAGAPALEADTVVVACGHEAAAALLPAGSLGDRDLTGLGHSPIVNVHLVLDRRVTDLELAAAVGSPVQFVFDRTASSGARTGQVLVVSLSAADAWAGARPDHLVRTFHAALGDLFPAARRAGLVDGVVSRERTATFRGVPGTARLRPGPHTRVPGLYVAGAWTDTGWPATMEGAVRSGAAAAAAALARSAPGASLSLSLEAAPA